LLETYYEVGYPVQTSASGWGLPYQIPSKND